MSQFKFNLIFSVVLAFSVSSQAALIPGAQYFKGQVQVGRGQLTTCYVEILNSEAANQIQVRSISTLQHLSSSGQLIWVGVGPFVAQFVPARMLYRYQDATPRALVKDMVVNLSAQGLPTKHAILYWHNQAGHHDPVVCDKLISQTSAQELLEVETAFSRFDELKP